LWIWTAQQGQVFDMVKQALTSPPVLALYNPYLITAVSADASSVGVSGALIQQQDDGVN